MFKFGFAADGNPLKDESIESPLPASIELKLDQYNRHIIENYRENASRFSCGFQTILHLQSGVAVRNAQDLGLKNISLAESQHSDLLPGVYEGGLKIWECTKDLADYLNAIQLIFDRKSVLDLGCGAGILGIFTLQQGAKVTFQDYNNEVIELLTVPNVLLNVPSATSEYARFFSGDWAAFLKSFKTSDPDGKFDVILTSETIYNPSNYGKLHDVIAQLLSPTGVCFLAAKSTYFGVGGTCYGFQEFLHGQGQLVAEPCWSNQEGVRREILKITHKNPN